MSNRPRVAKPTKSVNELLANLRTTAASSSSNQPSILATATPSVPPAIRQILQIPETPAPLPRRPVRRRFDNYGRRLPAGPPPPGSWSRPPRDPQTAQRALESLSTHSLATVTLPGAYMPAPGSLLDLVARRMALEWQLHRQYDSPYLYYIPTHIKPVVMRHVAMLGEPGLSVKDLKALLLPQPDSNGGSNGTRMYDVEDLTILDISGAIGKTISLGELSELLFPTQMAPSNELQDSWETEDVHPSIPTSLLPKLTHLSLAVDPKKADNASWKQLLSLASKLTNITHLSLAFWPAPCLTRKSQFTSMSSPHQRDIAYSGTNYYSHSIDQDWSEALLVLRLLSKSLYSLEFLDLTGCISWFKALILEDDDSHDHVDWAGNWGKITTLRLHVGWDINENDMPSKYEMYERACEAALAVEKRIISMRAGRGRFITVERPTLNKIIA